jgi:hypothetical protein
MSEIRVDTISEKTSANGVAIDGVTLKDGGIAATLASTITTADNTDTLSLISTDADATSGPNLRLFRNSSSPADSDDIGKITFSAENDASEEIDYITVRGDLNDVTDGTEDGVLKIAGLIGGAVKEFARFGDGVGVVFNEESNAANDFRIESDGNTHMLFVDGGNDRVAIGTSNVSSTAPLSISSGFAKTDTSSRAVLNLQSNEASAQSQLRIMNIGHASNQPNRKWQLQTSEAGVANSGQLELQVDGGSVQMGATGGGLLFVGADDIVVNEGSTDTNFRVESNGNANMIFVDGGNNHVCIGTSTDHGGVLNVDGPVLMSESDTLLLRITSSGSDIKFQSRVSDKDIRFEGIDGGSDITALHLDMSDGGQLITSNGATINGQSVVSASLNDVIFYTENTATSGNVFGQSINFSSTVNDTGSYFTRGVGNNQSTVRWVIFANGDFDSATNSYGATSDERIKQNITDANSQWDDIKGLKVRNFKLKDEARTEAGGGQAAKTYLGLVAQEAETVSPGLVKSRAPEKSDIISSSEFGTLYEDGDDIPEGKEIGDVKEVTEQVKSVSYSVLYMKAIKALQEAQTRIETLETKVAALEG